MLRAFLLAVLCGTSCTYSAAGNPGGANPTTSDSLFGLLPPDPRLSIRLAGVHTEIVIGHLVGPEVYASRLPRGMTAITLSSRRDSATVQFLTRHPEYANHVLSTLGFVLLDTLDLGTFRVGSNGPVRMAFWWMPVRTSDSLDARAQGFASLELGQWLTDPAAIRVWRDAGVAATQADIAMSQSPAGTWRVSLRVGESRFSASCRTTGPASPMRFPLPAYDVVWQATHAPGVFTLYTYYGHYSQPCDGSLSADGNHPLSIAIRSTPDGYPSHRRKYQLQDRWRARAAVYQRS